MNVTAVHELAANQGGLVAVQQAAFVGLTVEVLRSHFRRRGWRRVAPGVWLAPGAPEPDLIRVRAAILSVGQPVAAARWTAATVHGLHRPRLITQLVVPAGRKATTLERVQTLRSRTLTNPDVVVINGIPVTGMARTICDLAATADLDALRRLVIDARQRRLLTLERLVEQLAKAGAVRGRRKIVRILRELDRQLVDSEFERLVVAWLRSEGIEVVTQYRLETTTRTVHLDIAIPSLRLAIECNGFGGHSERRHQTIDSVRTKAIQIEDWLVVPLTWDEFTTAKQAFLDALLATMAMRSKSVTP